MVKQFLAAVIVVSLAAGGALAKSPFQRGGVPSAAVLAGIWGPGGTTLSCIDHDNDGYGTGPGCTARDADDDDAAVNTVASWQAAYASIDALLAARGYTGILRYWSLDPVSGNDATCAAGTSAVALAAPCLTWTPIRAGMAAGDTVVLRGGQTAPGNRFPLDNRGTPTNPILIIGYPGEEFILDRTGTGDGVAGVGVTNITIDGFKIINTSGAGNGIIIDTGPVNVTVRNMETYQNYTGLRMFNGLDNILIEKNYFRENTGTEMVYLGARGSPGVDVTFRHNIIYHNSGVDSGFPAVQYNGRVTNYVVEDNVVFGHAQCFSFLQGVSDSFFRNNICFGGTSVMLTIYNYPGDQLVGCTCDAATQICPHDQTNNLVENNTLVRPQYKRDGTPISGSGFLPTLHVVNTAYCTVGDLGSNTFKNNISYGYGDYPLFQFRNPIAESGPYIASSTFEGNVFYRTGTSSPDKVFLVDLVTPTEYTIAEFETLYNSLSPTGTFTGNVLADPQFVTYSEDNWDTPGNNNFHLQPGSPASGKGAFPTP